MWAHFQLQAMDEMHLKGVSPAPAPAGNKMRDMEIHLSTFSLAS